MRDGAPHSTESGAVRVVEARSKADIDTFIEVPWTVYRNDPHWSPPLRLERRRILDRRRNPYFEHADAAFFIAERNGLPVGRISAQVDTLALGHQGAGIGHFGFLEAVDDPAVFAALFAAAEAWLRNRGMTRALGPFSPSINAESGLLVEGFDEPPRIMMGHARPYYARHVEAAGYAKAHDLLAYDLDITREFSPPVQRLLARTGSMGKLRVRRVQKLRLGAEMRLVLDIFNDAWSENWGFVPMTEAEMVRLGADLWPFLPRDIFMIAEWDGEPAAFMMGVPDINAASRDLNGRLWPLGWAPLLWRLVARPMVQSRVPLMGVRRSFQGTAAGAAMALLLIETIRAAFAGKSRHHRAELSWILESNAGMRRILESLDCRAYKTYRIYEKLLA